MTERETKLKMKIRKDENLVGEKKLKSYKEYLRIERERAEAERKSKKEVIHTPVLRAVRFKCILEE